MPSRPAPPQPTVICFVRHGTTPTTGRTLPGRAVGLHLSEKGEQEAAAVAERLAVVGPVAAVYASPLERARETAKPIAARLGQRVRIERGLLECEFGEWTGKELKDLSKLPEWQTVQRHPSGFRFPSGESFVELEARLAATVERLVARHPGQVVVAVSHADPIKIAVGDALGVPLDLVQRTVISPCSVSAVAYGRNSPVVLTVNSMGDLSPLGIKPPPPAKPARRRTIRKEATT
jgi:probable phosphomutase (TIGR03848 family)